MNNSLYSKNAIAKILYPKNENPEPTEEINNFSRKSSRMPMRKESCASTVRSVLPESISDFHKNNNLDHLTRTRQSKFFLSSDQLVQSEIWDALNIDEELLTDLAPRLSKESKRATHRLNKYTLQYQKQVTELKNDLKMRRNEVVNSNIKTNLPRPVHLTKSITRLRSPVEKSLASEHKHTVLFYQKQSEHMQILKKHSEQMKAFSQSRKMQTQKMRKKYSPNPK